MKSGSQRSERVGDLIKREMAEIFIRGDIGENFGFLTVTKVDLSRDLKNANIYISIHGDEEEKDVQFKKLLLFRKKMRHLLAQNLNLRYTPVIKLHRDDSLDNAIKVQELLTAIDKSEEE